MQGCVIWISQKRVNTSFDSWKPIWKRELTVRRMWPSAGRWRTCTVTCCHGSWQPQCSCTLSSSSWQRRPPPFCRRATLHESGCHRIWGQSWRPWWFCAGLASWPEWFLCCRSYFLLAFHPVWPPPGISLCHLYIWKWQKVNHCSTVLVPLIQGQLELGMKVPERKQTTVPLGQRWSFKPRFLARQIGCTVVSLCFLVLGLQQKTT